MSENYALKMILCGSHVLHLLIENQTPYVEYNDKKFIHLVQLVEELPFLSQIDHIKVFRQVANFFWKGFSFECIENIASYQQNYIKQVELEKTYSGDVFPYRLTDYKIFDVSVMHDPLVKDKQLFFYVYNILTGLPYRVVCPFPYDSPSTLVHYQILPILEDSVK